MIKLLLLGLALTFSCLTSFAQRLSFAQFCQLYEYTVENSNHNLDDISHLLRSNAENWRPPFKKEVGDELQLVWEYKVNNSVMGWFQASNKTTRLQNGNVFSVKKATYSFCYGVEYKEYLDAVSANASLVNTFTENGCIYRIYESSYLTFALITVPAYLHQFFIDGLPADSYIVEVHRKL